MPEFGFSFIVALICGSTGSKTAVWLIRELVSMTRHWLATHTVSCIGLRHESLSGNETQPHGASFPVYVYVTRCCSLGTSRLHFPRVEAYKTVN